MSPDCHGRASVINDIFIGIIVPILERKIERLRTLPAFVNFEQELVGAIEETAGHQGFRR